MKVLTLTICLTGKGVCRKQKKKKERKNKRHSEICFIIFPHNPQCCAHVYWGTLIKVDLGLVTLWFFVAKGVLTPFLTYGLRTPDRTVEGQGTGSWKHDRGQVKRTSKTGNIHGVWRKLKWLGSGAGTWNLVTAEVCFYLNLSKAAK